MNEFIMMGEFNRAYYNKDYYNKAYQAAEALLGFIDDHEDGNSFWKDKDGNIHEATMGHVIEYLEDVRDHAKYKIDHWEQLYAGS